MAFPAPSERRFERLNCALHERIQFSPTKISHSLSTVFEEIVFNRSDQPRGLAEFEANRKKSCSKTSDTAEEIVYDRGHKSVEVYLALSGVSSQNNVVESVSITDSVEELCEGCFYLCKRLFRVTFGESSSLKLIGKEAFIWSGVREIHIPDGVEELCEKCFYECESLSRVTFGESSSLKLIGKCAFMWSDLSEVHIPDGVEELCEECFSWCGRISRVTFGESSSLKLIGKNAFCGCDLTEIHIPDGVEVVPCDPGPCYTRIVKP